MSDSAPQGDYGSLPSTIDQLCAEVERAILEQGGDDSDAARQYAHGGGEGMRVYFDSWLAVPDPADFDAASTQLRQVLPHLNAGGPSPAQNRTQHSSTQFDTSIFDVQSNRSLQRVVDGASVFDQFDGRAMTAFRETFLLDFGNCLANQFAAVVDLRSSLAVMSATWEAARSNVAGIAEQALVAARTLPGGNASLAATLDLLAVGAAVASVVPGAGVVAGLIGAGTALAGTLASSPEPAQADVTDVFGITEYLEAALPIVSSQLTKVEGAVDDLFAAYVSKMNGQPQLFALGADRRFLRESDPDQLVPAYDRNDGHELKAQPPKMVHYASLMDDGVSALRQARAALEEGRQASPSSAWARSSVGMAPLAGWNNMTACLSGLIGAASDTARHTSDCADQLRLVARLFDTTDAGVGTVMSELRRHDRRVEVRDDDLDRGLPGGLAPLPMGPFVTEPNP